MRRPNTMIRQPVRLGNGLPKPVPRYLICAAPSDISAGFLPNGPVAVCGPLALKALSPHPATSRVKPIAEVTVFGRDPAIYPPPFGLLRPTLSTSTTDTTNMTMVIEGVTFTDGVATNDARNRAA